MSGVIIMLIWRPKWVDSFPEAQRTIAWNHALPLIDLLSSIEVLGSRACQLASLLIRSAVWRSLRENRSGTDIAVGGKPECLCCYRECLEWVSKNSSVNKKNIVSIYTPFSVVSLVKHKINMFLIYKKELIKHHRSNGKD